MCSKVQFTTAAKQQSIRNFADNQGLETSPKIQHQLIQQRMANNNDIAWAPILYCVGAGIAGLAIGTFLVAPMVQKMKAKKAMDNKKKTTATPAKK